MDCYEAALLLLEDEYQTIPINYYKRPKLEFKNVPITKEFIEANKTVYQEAKGLALLCRGIWCIDIDVNHDEGENGFESLQELEDVWPDIVKNGQNTFVQTTPRGGKHLVFRKVDGIDYRQHIGYLKGVDIKAQDNNFFVLTGSQTASGEYTNNVKDIAYFDGTYIDYFDGTFEDRIFSSGGSYDKQTLEKYDTKYIMPDYKFSSMPSFERKGGAGKQAYQRIIECTSENRNDDLFLAATYAKQCDVPLEPLRILIGDSKNGDTFTEEEWQATVDSANS